MIDCDIAESLIQNKSLTTLNLNGNYLKQGSGGFIMMILMYNKMLNNLYMKGNAFDEEDCKNILEGIKSNKSIKELLF
jgi:hypothetical protein